MTALLRIAIIPGTLRRLGLAFVVAILTGLPARAQPIADRNALPLREAVRQLIDKTFADAKENLPDFIDAAIYPVVIDPLIDRVTGYETLTTQTMAQHARELMREKYQHFEVVPFTSDALQQKPFILLGSITPVTAPGSLQNAEGPSDTYRIWTVLVDTRNNTILSHPTAWVRATEVDMVPVPFNRDAPVWAPDGAHAAYIRTCAGAPGSQADPAYIEGLQAEALIVEGMTAYAGNEFARAQSRFVEVVKLPRGQQLRAFNGLYLSNVALNDKQAAANALDLLFNYAVQRDRLMLKMVFEPGYATWTDTRTRAQYHDWLRRIAAQLVASPRNGCILVAGHASPTGVPILNDVLSRRRARYVLRQVVNADPSLQSRLLSQGFGSSQVLVGTATDDRVDVLDRRVEFRPQPCTRAS